MLCIKSLESTDYFWWALLLSVTILIIKQATIGEQYFGNVKLFGKTVIVTGANSGIGYETALACAQRGANVILACRDRDKSVEALRCIQKQTGNENIEHFHLNLASFKSIREFVNKIKESKQSIYALVNNAGIFWCPFSLTDDGVESNFGVNHLGHFLLTLLLLPLLEKQDGGSVVVMVSSLMHQFGNIGFLSDINFKRTEYNFWSAYSNSKLCNVVFARLLAKKLIANNISVCSVDPGIIRSNIGRNSKFINLTLKNFGFFWWLFSKDVCQGAQTTIFCVCSEEVKQYKGGYFRECQHTYPSRCAYDIEFENLLWKISIDICGIQQHELSRVIC